MRVTWSHEVISIVVSTKAFSNSFCSLSSNVHKSTVVSLQNCGSSQTPGVFHAGGGSLTTDTLRLFRKEQQKGEIEWPDCILMFVKRNLKDLALAHDGTPRGQRMNLQQSLTTTRIRTSRKTSLTGQGLKYSPCWSRWVIGWFPSCRHVDLSESKLE